MVSNDEQPQKAPATWLSEYIPPRLLFITHKTNVSPPNKKPPIQDHNAMNRSVTSLWNLNKTTTSSPTPTASGPSTPAEDTSTDPPPSTATLTTNETTSKMSSKKRSNASSARGSSAKKAKGVQITTFA